MKKSAVNDIGLKSSQSSSSEPAMDDDFDWDESSRTVTALTWAKAQSRLPMSGKRVYGRRANTTTKVDMPTEQYDGDATAFSGQNAATSTFIPLSEDSATFNRSTRRPSKKRNMFHGSESNAFESDVEYLHMLESECVEDEDLKDFGFAVTENNKTSDDRNNSIINLDKYPTHDAHRPPMVPRAAISNKVEKPITTDTTRADLLLEDENMHPNSTTTAHASVKRNYLKSLPRGDSPYGPTNPPFGVDNAAPTFSSLSKAGPIAPSWAIQKTPCSTPIPRGHVFHRASMTSTQGFCAASPGMSVDDPIIELETSSSIVHNSYTSPTQSVSSSSRKRGSCESPPWVDDDQDGMITLCTSEVANTDNIPSNMFTYDDFLSQPTTPFGFLLPSSTFMLSSPSSMQKMRLHKEAEGVFYLEEGQSDSGIGFRECRSTNVCNGDSSDDDENDDRSHDSIIQDDGPEMLKDKKDTDIMMATSMDESDDEIKFKAIGSVHGNIRSTTLLVSRPPTQVRRMSFTNIASFTDSVFGPVDKGVQDTNGNFLPHSMSKKFEENPLLVFDTMSSYDDLKYLVKELRRLKSGKTFTSFGAFKSWAVPLLYSWSSERRTAFIAWTSRDLGFRLRTGGNSIQFLQIQSSSGSDVLRALEMALFEHKKLQTFERILASNSIASGADEVNASHSVQFSSQIASNKLPISRSITDRLILSRPSLGPLSRDIDRHLSIQLSTMNLESLESSLKPSSSNYHSEKSPCRLSRSRDAKCTPLARTITIENSCAIEYSSAISGNLDTRGRPSTDGMMNSHDILSQMYCDSPILDDSLKRMDSIGSHGLSRKSDPVSQQIIKMRSDRSLHFSPGCLAHDTSISATSSFDYVGAETPMPKTIQAWGSQPIPGKDWGLSLGCTEGVVKYLSICLDEERCVLHVPAISSKVILKSGLHSPRLSMNSLGFEFDYCDPDRDKKSIDEGLVHNASNLLERQFSVGSQEFGRLVINDIGPSPEKLMKRKFDSMNKLFRMSICNAAFDNAQDIKIESLTKRSFATLTESNPTSADHAAVVQTTSHDCSHSLYIVDRNVNTSQVLNEEKLLSKIFGYLNYKELFQAPSAVCSCWNRVVTASYQSLLLQSIEQICHSNEYFLNELPEIDDKFSPRPVYDISSSSASFHRSWNSIVKTYPRGQYLSEGTFKKVYKAWNARVDADEVLSVVDLTKIDEPRLVGIELAVYVMLSSLTRRNICPNFLLVRGVFTSSDEPPSKQWSEVASDDGLNTPSAAHYQYIRMELCTHGDVETFIRRQPDAIISSSEARIFLFQMAFSLHVAGHHFSLKHNDIKLLNFLLQSADSRQNLETSKPFTTLRYGVGSHIFDLQMNTSRAFIVKLADFGTANLMDSNGFPVTIANFTTLENIPPEFMILGDAAKQGHTQDSFALGLCMFHLYTGQGPYEEIMENVKCPKILKRKLTRIWIKSPEGFEVIRSVILGDLCEDEYGNFDGEVDETLFDTLYRYLVLFGIPEIKQQMKDGSKVWTAINSCLVSQDHPPRPTSRPVRKAAIIKPSESENDTLQFKIDSEKFSLKHGNNIHISRVRETLLKTEGAMDLLQSLVNFDPNARASVLDIINSRFMIPLRLQSGTFKGDNTVLYSYMAYSGCKIK